MSKRLKLAGLSTSRTLRSGKTPVNVDSSEETSSYFAGEESATGTRKRAPIKTEGEAMDNETETGVTSVVVKSEDVSTDVVKTDISIQERGMKNENVEPTDSENVQNEERWMPRNWEIILENIKEMRRRETAPVDTMGCHRCADPSASPVVSRYQSLIALMLSSQTKDQVTHAAMQRLNSYGCRPDVIAATSDDVLGKLIYPVGFWKVKTSLCVY